jgi:hypothetical protein
MHIDPLGQEMKTCCWLCSRTTTFTTGGYVASPWFAEPCEVQYPGKNAIKGCNCKLRDKLGIKDYGLYSTETKLYDAHKGNCCACTISVKGSMAEGHAVFEISCPNNDFLSVEKWPEGPWWKPSTYFTAYILFHTGGSGVYANNTSATISCDAAKRLKGALKDAYGGSYKHPDILYPVTDNPSNVLNDLNKEPYIFPVYECEQFAFRWFNKGLSMMCGN